MKHGWMYLYAIMDWYSRYIVDWQLDQSLEIEFVLETMKRALARRKPGVINSDQGSHFTSPQYINLLKENEVQISMDGKGRTKDNIVIERFWRSLKYNEVYINDYNSPREDETWCGRLHPFAQSLSAASVSAKPYAGYCVQPGRYPVTHM
jgi:putative transposase